MNLQQLTPYIQYWNYYKTNHCLPPIALSTLQEIEAIYRKELHPAPVRLYCGVCVADMFTSLFGEWERKIANAADKIEINDSSQKNLNPKNQNKKKEIKIKKEVSSRKSKKTIKVKLSSGTNIG
jgi:hypothetical protein